MNDYEIYAYEPFMAKIAKNDDEAGITSYRATVYLGDSEIESMESASKDDVYEDMLAYLGELSYSLDTLQKKVEGVA